MPQIHLTDGSGMCVGCDSFDAFIGNPEDCGVIPYPVSVPPRVVCEALLHTNTGLWVLQPLFVADPAPAHFFLFSNRDAKRWLVANGYASMCPSVTIGELVG